MYLVGKRTHPGLVGVSRAMDENRTVLTTLQATL